MEVQDYNRMYLKQVVIYRWIPNGILDRAEDLFQLGVGVTYVHMVVVVEATLQVKD